MGAYFLLAVAAGSSLPATALRLHEAQRSASELLSSYEWNDFVVDFSRPYTKGSQEWDSRKQLFEERRNEALEFNAQPGNTWKMGVTKFMDYTESERKRVLGYTGSGSRRQGLDRPEAASLRRSEPLEPMPDSYDVVMEKHELLKIVRDQGNCGSCWAEAATSVLEGVMERNETLMAELHALRNRSKKVPSTPTLASQVVVSCTPNERHCGGKGGCSGATVELAYDMLKREGGLPFASEWNYVSGMSGSAPQCDKGIFNHHKIGITSYTILPSNKYDPLKAALVQTAAPIAISVDASSWFMYSQGVYSDGKGQFTVNHAVMLTAYKNYEGNTPGYWKIKNSWGSYWGENGFIRVEMKPNEEEHCGWDHNTHDGLACDGDPDTAWVCGTCGILYDSVYPSGLYLVPYDAA